LTAEPITKKPKLQSSVDIDSAGADPTAGTLSGSVKSQNTQPFRPQLNLVASITPTSDFYSSIQGYIDTIVEQAVIEKITEVRQEIKAEYEEKILSLVKLLEQQKSAQSPQEIQTIISGIESMTKPEFLESIILNPISGGYHIAFIHTLEDRVRALQVIEELLSRIQDLYPTINFEPTILHITDTESYSSTGMRIRGTQ
jgi:hypothetical protein